MVIKKKTFYFVLQKERGRQRKRWLYSMDMSLRKLQEIVEDRGAGVLKFIPKSWT